MKFLNFELFPSLNDFDREFTVGIDHRYGGRTTIEELDGGYKLKRSYPGEETIIVIDRLGYINISQIWLFGGNVVPSDYITRRVIAECS